MSRPAAALNAARALPAGPDAALSTDDFPTLSKHFKDPVALRQGSLAFLQLSPSAFLLFTAIWHHLWGALFAWPTQERLAITTGLSVRTIRTRSRELEGAGILTLVRVRRARRLGGFYLRYTPGPELRRVIQVLVAAKLERRQQERSEKGPGLARAPRATGNGDRLRPATVAANLDLSPVVNLATSSSNPRPDLEGDPSPPSPFQEEASFSIAESPEETHPPAEAPSPPRPAPVVTQDDAKAAVDVLGHLFKARNPTAAVPSWWDQTALATVACRLAEVPGTVDDKVRAGKRAIRHAVATAKQFPSVRYVFGTQEYFQTHVAECAELEARDVHHAAELERLAQERARRDAADAARASAPATPPISVAPYSPRQWEANANALLAALTAPAEGELTPPEEAAPSRVSCTGTSSPTTSEDAASLRRPFTATSIRTTSSPAIPDLPEGLQGEAASLLATMHAIARSPSSFLERYLRSTRHEAHLAFVGGVFAEHREFAEVLYQHLDHALAQGR